MVQITIQAAGPLGKKISRAPDLPYVAAFPDPIGTTIGDVKKLISVKYPKFSIERQRITIPRPENTTDSVDGKQPAAFVPADEQTLAELGLSDGGVLDIKDLGKQISWRTVYLIEYLGPIIFHIWLYNNYPSDVKFKKSLMQQYAYYMILAHFVKRELETIFIHRFSKSTMPFTYVFRNSAHYWLLGGLFLAVSLYGPWYANLKLRYTTRDDPVFLNTCLVIWAILELMNFSAHWTLMNLRPKGTRTRGIPRSPLFAKVSCPNYTTEIAGWCVVWLMTGDNWCGLFTVVGAITMAKWAIGKHRKYKKDFGDKYPRGRKAIFPWLL